MQFFSWLRSLFLSADTPAHPYVPSAHPFPELDARRLQQELRLVADGTTRGKAEQPATTQDAFDALETRVVDAVQGEAARAHGTLLEHLSAYSERLQVLGVRARLAEILAAAESARSEFKTKVTSGRDLLYQLRTDVRAIATEVRDFQRRHGLDRLPRHPHSRTWHFGLIAILILIESSLNGLLFARGSEFGLLGGVSQALLIAAVNVGLGVVGGAVIARHAIHVRWWIRIAAILGLVLFVIVVPTFNLAVAHYRAAYTGPSPETAERDALVTFVHSPFEITEVSGWLLFLMGMAFSTLAAWDGWRLDDPYPGYGALARRRDQLFDDYVSEKDELTSILESTRADLIDRQTNNERDLESRIRQYKEVRTRANEILSQFTQHLNHLERVGNELLAIYREANKAARSTATPPHFESYWRLDRTPYAVPATASPGEDLTPAGQEVAHQLADVRRQIDADYQAAILEYESISAVIEDDDHEHTGRPRTA